MSTANTVVLKQEVSTKELKAGGAITPGHLVARSSTNTVVVHATAGGFTPKVFAKEDELQGKGISDAYAEGAPVQLFYPDPGDEINALIKASENIAIGDPLTSAGDGTLKKATLTEASDTVGDWVIGIALEATNVATVARIAIEIV